MKKRLLTVLTSLALIAVMIATLCACSTYGGIKKAYEKEGYKEIDSSETAEIGTTVDETVKAFVGEEYVGKVKVHVLQKGGDDSSILGGILSSLDIVIIVEFKGDKDMVNSLKDKLGVEEEDVKKAYDELQKLDGVSGTCVLVLATNPSAANIFKGTK